MISVNIEKAGYVQNQEIISNVYFKIQKGQLVGLIGSNGAGKSTTIKSIIGTMPFLKGKINKTENEIQTYVPEHPSFYHYLTLREHIRLKASLHHIPKEVYEKRAQDLLSLFNLDTKLDHFPIHFSKGMKQKAMLLFSFITEADFFIIDEPFIGLDPKATKDLLHLIEKERKRGACILMCTHVLDTAERYCDSFVLLHEGKILSQGNLEEVRQKAGLPSKPLLECFYKLQESEEALS
ncbi:ABC transporter ATP-binding protein [Priestia filamentosa]|uniref:ABC transporter ATP-binding protein n=1 Tax=Priestia filamentosa TaxID=1402861 RepID=UPI00058951CC